MGVPSELAARLLLISLALLFSFSLFLVIFIILYRYASSYKEKHFQHHYQRITQELLAALTSPHPGEIKRVALKNKRYPGPLTAALLDMSRLIKGPERNKLQAIFSLALEDRVRKHLRSPFLLRRLLAARLLEFFADSMEKISLSKLLSDKPPVRLAALAALARFPSKEAVRFILQALEEDALPDFQTYQEILFPLGQTLEEELKERLKKPLPPEKIAFYIELIGLIPLRQLYPDLLPFVCSKNKEIRIKTVRAISRLELPEALPVLLQLLQDPEWEVQAQAVRGLGKLNNPEVIPFLRQALHSPSWFVRLNAKEALLELGEAGAECLEEVAGKSKDKFAADMARLGLTEYRNREL